MTTTEHPVMPPIECAAWCADGDGHPREVFREDQNCWSYAEYVDLSLRSVHVEASGEFPQSLGVMVRRDQERAVVYLHLRDINIRGSVIDDSLHLTPDEAERLAATLLEKAALVRAEGNQPT